MAFNCLIWPNESIDYSGGQLAWLSGIITAIGGLPAPNRLINFQRGIYVIFEIYEANYKYLYIRNYVTFLVLSYVIIICLN